MYKIRNFITISTFKIRDRKKIARKPWISSALMNFIIKKENLYKKWLTEKTSEMAESYYKNYSKILSKSIKVAKRRWDRREVLNKNNIPKKLQSFINSKIKDTVCKTSKIDYMYDVDGNSIEDDLLIAENINSFFANIGVKIASSIDNNNLTPQTTLPDYSAFMNLQTDYLI